MHDPVLCDEVVAALLTGLGGRYIDATLGDGGHALALLKAAGDDGAVLGLDRDVVAIKSATKRLSDFGERFQTAQTNFGALSEVAERTGFNAVDGVLFDLGVRSNQLDEAERGFSFMREGPLDMRMDQDQADTAARWVNEADEADLAEVFWKLGEERASRRIAKAIVARRAERPFEQTLDLAAVISEATGGRRGRIHPATRAFMALRMVVNQELEEIEAGLAGAIQCLKPGGRLAVITYHSIEDRLVKRILARHIGRWESLQAGGRVWIGDMPRMERVTRKPLIPTTEELEQNARARSAKLRIVERSES